MGCSNLFKGGKEGGPGVLKTMQKSYKKACVANEGQNELVGGIE